MTKKSSAAKRKVATFFNHIDLHSHLCSKCGGCIAVCPTGAICLKKVENGNKIKFDQNKCNGCQKCLAICPSREINIKKIKTARDLIGNFSTTYKGHSNKKTIRQNGSSGGLATAILSFGLKEKLFDKVICLDGNEQYPPKNKAIIVEKPDELLKCSGSKYESFPICSALKKINNKESVAITCLPCHAKAISKMRLKNVFTVGLFCSGQISQDFNQYLLKKEKIDPIKVKKVQHRQGKWPGKTIITLKNKRKIEINFNQSYLSAAFGSLIFSPDYCLLCDDLFCQQADVSLGDPWKINKPNRNSDDNLIIVRTKKGERIINMMARKKKISIGKINFRKALYSQADSIERKKIGIYPRIKLLKRLGVKLPELTKIKPPMSQISLFLLYPIELINIFNCFLIKKNRVFYKLTFILPKSFMFAYRFSLLGLQRLIRELLFPKCQK